jgi:hypothetical protein
MFMTNFLDDDEHPEGIEDGFVLCNKAVIVSLKSTKETTK